MMQPHGGGVEGFHFPLRKGTEVVLAFLGGDPDRPVIAGVVPNAHTPSPVTSGNHTKNVLQTGGRNRFELEDLDGQQRISLSTPYANTYIRMGAPNEDHELIVKTDENSLVDVKATTDFKLGMRGRGDWNVDVQDAWKTHVHNKNLETTVHTGDLITKVNAGNMTTTVATGNMETNVNTGFRRTMINGQDVKEVKGSLWSVSTPNGSVLQSCKGPFNIAVADSTAELSAKGKVTIKSEDDIEISTPGKTVKVDCTKFEDTSVSKKSVWGSVSDLAKGKWTILKLGEWVEVGVSGKVSVSASASASLSLSFSVGAKFGASLEHNGVVDLKQKMAKVEQCMTKVVESPFIDVHAAAIMITCPLIQATSALKVI